MQIVKKICLISIYLFLFYSCVCADNSKRGEASSFFQTLDLSAEEKAWINTRPVIQVGGPRYFPPFHFYENQTEHKGISVEYLRSIFDPLGIRINVHTDIPWAEVLERVQKGEIDLIACAAITEERKSYLDFSIPYLSFPLVIISRKDADFIGGINDLHGKKLASIKKSSTNEWLKKDGIEFVPHYVNSPLEGLKAVSFNQADARIENLAAASYLIQKYGLTNLKIAAPTPYGNYDLHMAVRKDMPMLLSIINKSLSKIEPEAHIEKKNKWLSVRYEYGITMKDLLKWLIPIVAASVIIIGFMLIWNRKLKNESLQRKIAQEKLKESEEKYRHLFKNAPSGMYEIDFENNKFTKVNEAMCQYTGYSEKEFLEIDPTTLLTSESLALYLERLEKKLIGKASPDAIEYKVKKKNGQTFSVVLDAEYFSEGEKMVGAQVVAHDITRLKEIEDEKIRAQKIAGENEKLALVGRIAGKMAHDFNNLLGIIMGKAEITMDESTDPEVQEALKVILDQTIRGRNITRNLVAFARDQEPRQEKFNILEKIDLVLNLMEKDLQGIKLVRENKNDLPELAADPGMIEHAILNLLQNAIHAVSLEKSPVVKIQTSREKNNLCIAVEDNGCGIPENVMDRIYDPAFGLKGSRDSGGSYRPGIKGSGYGLANVKKYVEQHDGRIEIQSEISVGTRAEIYLPIEKNGQANNVDHNKNAPHFKEKRILLVEDESDISEVFSMVLSRKPINHQVNIAPDFDSAVTLFEKNRYDFISLDYMLPGKMTGMDVYKYVRKKNKTIPVLFVSGNFAFIESIKELKQKDAYIDHISKPCQNKDYLDRVNQLLGKTLQNVNS